MVDKNSDVTEGDGALASWDKVYNSNSGCLERVWNPLAFPFYLAELARAPDVEEMQMVVLVIGDDEAATQRGLEMLRALVGTLVRMTD